MHLIHTHTTILTRIACTVVNICVAVSARPSRFTDALIPEQLVNAESTHTRLLRTQVNLFFTSFATESVRTIAGKIVDQVSAVSAQQTWLLQTIIDVSLA